jgi:hypothetical protein
MVVAMAESDMGRSLSVTVGGRGIKGGSREESTMLGHG